MSQDNGELRAQSYVGFETITRQIEHKLLKRGFQFNVMVVGQTGLGKSTMVNTLFASHLIESKGRLEVDGPMRQTTEIKEEQHVIVEGGVRLKLNIVDTPGYGDQVNNEGCWEPIVRYIKDQYSTYLRKELTAQRDRFIPDTRIHCCLFFINPTGHSLNPIDTEEHDQDEIALNERIRSMIPLAVVGSERSVVVDGKSVRGRKTRWGVVNVEDERHCEFVYLRNFLTRTHLQDLIESTALNHYEAFRSKQLTALKESSAKQQQASSMAREG